MQVEPEKGHDVLTNAAAGMVQEAMPLIDIPAPSSDQRERLDAIFEAVRTFDSKAVIRGFRATGRRR